MIIQPAVPVRPFWCFSDALERILDKKVQAIALNCIERLVDWIMTRFSSTYRLLYQTKLMAIPSLENKIAAAQLVLNTHRVPFDDRLKGTIEGQAIGDTLGLLTEFETGSSARAMIAGRPLELDLKHDPAFVNGPRGAHRNAFPEGWTDDTDQYVLGVRAKWLKENDPQYAGFSLSQVFAQQLNHWYHHGLDSFHGRFAQRGLPACRGLGRLVGAVLAKPHFVANPEQAALEAWRDPNLAMGDGFRGRPAANGAIMRTAFVGAIAYRDLRKVVQDTVTFCKTTHADPRSIASSVALSVAIALFLRGCGDVSVAQYHASEIAKQVLRSEMPRTEPIEPYIQEFDLYMNGNWQTLQLDQGGIGYTYKCMGSAFHALRLADRFLQQNPGADRTQAFRRSMEELVAQGGDADTNGAVAGALMGAYLGLEQIPVRWAAEMADQNVLDQTWAMITELSAR